MPDVLACDLANVNMVLHVPGALLAAAWVEATRGDFTFYVQGMTPGVARVMQSLDEERRAVARAFGHDLPPLVAEMQAIGTVEVLGRAMLTIWPRRSLAAKPIAGSRRRIR